MTVTLTPTNKVCARPPLQIRGVTLKCKHFFRCVALYANGKICATPSPAGFAVKLPEGQRRSLIIEGKGEEFRFFSNGPINRDYVAFSRSVIQNENVLQEFVGANVINVLSLPDSNIVIDY